jgi:hypothetical protein
LSFINPEYPWVQTRISKPARLLEILQEIGTITTRPELLTGVEDDEKAVSRRLCLGRKDSDEKSERSVGETLRPPELMLSR